MEEIRVEILVYPSRKFELQLKWGIIVSKITEMEKNLNPPTLNSGIQIEMVLVKSRGGNYVFCLI